MQLILFLLAFAAIGFLAVVLLPIILITQSRNFVWTSSRHKIRGEAVVVNKEHFITSGRFPAFGYEKDVFVLTVQGLDSNEEIATETWNVLKDTYEVTEIDQSAFVHDNGHLMVKTNEPD